MNSPAKETSVMAIVSLVSGILGWTIAPFLGSIIAVITGHMARSEIRKNPATKDGDGLALAGLILGWVNILTWVLGIIFFGGMLLAMFGLIFAANGAH
ncbi:MAG: DUF4190 domain-containing protein [Arenimonas sp.]